MALVSAHQISKSYGGVHALREVDFQIQAGEIHALCGENGAGKSTLIKVLGGAIVPDVGSIEWNRNPVTLRNVRSAEAQGIVVIHQEAVAFPHLNAIDNIFVGRELTRWAGLALDHAQMRAQTEQLVDRLGEHIDLACPLGQLPLAQRQMVAIARALSHDCRLLIMDEPTASLSKKETDILFDVIRQLKAAGVSVLYVSHRLEEVFELSERVTVLRDGRRVATHDVKQLDRDRLIRLMVGRDLPPGAERDESSGGKERRILLQVTGLSRSPRFHDVSFEVRVGEIVGFAGLVGAGRSEVARAIFGIDPFENGEVVVDGTRLEERSVAAAMRHGVAFVPEDRQHEGLIIPLSVRGNLTLPFLRRLSRRGFIASEMEDELVATAFKDFSIKAESPESSAGSLSGGNQQKVVLGKWLASKPKVLILDEPTRGVDVGAKSEVHQLIRTLAEEGIGILLISSELPEVLALSHRILVMCQGRVVGELEGKRATQEQILAYALEGIEEEVGGPV